LKTKYLKTKLICLFFVFAQFQNAISQTAFSEAEIKAVAIQKIESGERSLAKALLTGWLLDHPFDPEGYWYRAQIHEYEKLFQEAHEDYSSMLHLEPRNREGRIARGRVGLKLKQYQSAKEDFEASLTLAPGKPTTVIYGQSTKDLSASENLTDQSENPADIYYQLGLCSIGLEEYDQAILFLDSAINLHPTEPDFFVEKALAIQKLGDEALALATYQKALNLNPNHFLARQRIALFGNDEAMLELEELNNSILEYPDNPETYLHRGLLLLKNKCYKEAYSDFDTVLLMDPEDTQTMVYRGKASSLLENWEAAQADFSQVIAIDPTYVEAYLFRGQNHYRAAKLEPALADFTAAISFDPEDANFYYHRGITLHRMSKIEEACADLSFAKELGMKEAENVWNKICSPKN
jgi:tetratricopeptide (TPR) repeat protein